MGSVQLTKIVFEKLVSWGLGSFKVFCCSRKLILKSEIDSCLCNLIKNWTFWFFIVFLKNPYCTPVSDNKVVEFCTEHVSLHTSTKVIWLVIQCQYAFPVFVQGVNLKHVYFNDSACFQVHALMLHSWGFWTCECFALACMSCPIDFTGQINVQKLYAGKSLWVQA